MPQVVALEQWPCQCGFSNRRCGRARSVSGGGAAVPPPLPRPSNRRSDGRAPLLSRRWACRGGRCGPVVCPPPVDWQGSGGPALARSLPRRRLVLPRPRQASKLVCARPRSAQDRSDGLTAKAASVRAERWRFLSQVAKLDEQVGKADHVASECASTACRPGLRASRYCGTSSRQGRRMQRSSLRTVAGGVGVAPASG